MKDKISSYTKWFEPSRFMPRPALRAVMRTNDAPQWPISHQDGKKVGPPSGPADSIALYPFEFEVPFETDEQGNQIPIQAKCDVKLTEDDWGDAKIDDILVVDMTSSTHGQEAGPEGGHTEWTLSGTCKVESGNHHLVTSNENIKYSNPKGNVAVCRYTLDVRPIEPGGQKKPEPCPCEGDTCNGDGGSPSGPAVRAGRSANAQNFSSAGCNVQADSTATLMYWSCNFGSFRGLGEMPSGRVELRAQENVSGLETPVSLAYNHPLASYLNIPEGGIVPGTRFDLVRGDRVIAMRCYNDGSVAPIGIDTSGGGKASLITEEQQSSLRWRTAAGETYLFSSMTGSLLSYTTADQQTISNTSAYLNIKRAEDGSLRQIWNLWDGLLNVETITETGYVIALYTPAQIGEMDEFGLYTVTGPSFKTFVLSLSRDESRFTITEQTPERQPYAVTWWKNGLAWNMQQGAGEEAVTTFRTHTELEATVWQLVTEKSKNNMTASRVGEVYQTTDVGDLLLTRVEGYGSEQELTTHYEYDAAGRLCKETKPDGSLWTWLYDAQGRVIRTDEPWGENGRRKTDITYAHSAEDNFNGEVAEKVVRLFPVTGKAKQLVRETYKYTVSNHVKRMEKRAVALGATGTRLTVTEQWLASAPDPYARGRVRMTQAVNGVQTWYDYAAANEQGALYTETEETRINGESIAGQSTRKTTWITAQGQRVREESYVLLSEGEWAFTDSADYEFDTQNRWVKRTRGNGRITERALMCDGRTLWEKDEDEVRIDYAYDTARQLVETSRSAVVDGEAVITPEIITSYIRDAAGRALSTTVYAGPMQTTQATSYDLIGRTISSSDILGRATAYTYSSDGLTVTKTLPSGATLITRSASDGTILEQSGTGQRHTLAIMDLVNDGIRTRTIAVSGENEVELQKVIVNGVGETLRSGTPNTTGGTVYTRYTYNGKGQLTKTQVDAGNAATTMAPSLWEYDSFGNVIKETWKLADTPTLVNSRITEYCYRKERREDGIYKINSITRNNSEGSTYTETVEQLVSSLSSLLESKTLSIDPRGNVKSHWTEYTAPGRRAQKEMLPTSMVIAEILAIDGFTTSAMDYAGLTRISSRSYTETGIIYTNTDARGNTSITKTDLAGRIVQIIDGAENTTDTIYHPHFDQVATVTNANGKTTCYIYDYRGRKIAEYGTAVQPVVLGYDEADRMTSLTTFRVSDGDINTNPMERMDGDTTTWSYHEATGLLVRKTYADATYEDTGYNALNMRATFTSPRGITATWGYNLKKGVNTSITYSDGSPGVQFVYNHLNQLMQVTDMSGIRNITYNQYGVPDKDRLRIDDVEYLITEHYDELNRTAGYTLKAGDTVVQAVSLGYDDKGRQSCMNVEGTEASFNWGYDAASGMIKTLNYPNGMKKQFSYEQNRNLVTGITYLNEEAAVKEMSYIYDVLGRIVQRTINDGQTVRKDSFAYNDRSEFTEAVLGADVYNYSYDNIGNRKIAEESARKYSYVSNNLNQYTNITKKEGTSFTPAYDLSGNQTLVKTSTGIWTVTYNAENRPTSFTSQDGGIIIECGYDYQGRRYMKKVTREGRITRHVRYLYRGYLQIAELDMLEATPVITEQYVWEPAAVEMKVLLWKHRKADGIFESCSLIHDSTKNVMAGFDDSGICRFSYDYAPYGSLKSAKGDLAQANKWRFSNEYTDEEMELTYYNYRHYNPADGRWINRDPIAEEGGWNLYGFVKNQLFILLDSWGLEVIVTQKATETVIHDNGDGLTYIKVRAEFAKDEPVCIKISKIEWWIVKEISSAKSSPDPWSNQLVLNNLELILKEMKNYFNLPIKKQYENTPFNWYKHIDAHESEHVKQFESVKETINKELPEAVKDEEPKVGKKYEDSGKRNAEMDALNEKWNSGFKVKKLPPKVLAELKQKYGTNDGLSWGEADATKAAMPLMKEAYKKLLEIYQSRK